MSEAMPTALKNAIALKALFLKYRILKFDIQERVQSNNNTQFTVKFSKDTIAKRDITSLTTTKYHSQSRE